MFKILGYLLNAKRAFMSRVYVAACELAHDEGKHGTHGMIGCPKCDEFRGKL